MSAPSPDRPAARRITLVYRLVMIVAGPVVRWWGRLQVTGAELLDPAGGLVLMANHDSHWDPVIVGIAAPRRQIRALAKSTLWNNAVVAWVLDQMGQIPIERGRGDTAALTNAITALEAGDCIGVFPEGTISRGRDMRALSGAGRLALAVPGSRVVAASITGSTDIVRFPKRPRIRVDFFEPADGPPKDGELAATLTKRIMAEVRGRSPFAVAGRGRRAPRPPSS